MAGPTPPKRGRRLIFPSKSSLCQAANRQDLDGAKNSAWKGQRQRRQDAVASLQQHEATHRETAHGNAVDGLRQCKDYLCQFLRPSGMKHRSRAAISAFVHTFPPIPSTLAYPQASFSNIPSNARSVRKRLLSRGYRRLHCLQGLQRYSIPSTLAFGREPLSILLVAKQRPLYALPNLMPPPQPT